MADNSTPQSEPKDARRLNSEESGGVRVPVTRSPSLEIANVDMTIVAHLGRDFAITGFATYPAVRTFTMDSSSDAIGADSLEYEQVYRETCSIRINPAAAGQMASSIIRSMRDADKEAFDNLIANLQDVLDARNEHSS